ncbi:MAG: circadian clock protein KaiC [Candidatus Brocadiia bacterium]
MPSETQKLSKTPSCINGLDDILEGGFPIARPTLVCGGPGCGKTTLGMEFIARGAGEEDEPGVFVSFEERPEDLKDNYASMPWDLSGLIDAEKVRFLHMDMGPHEIDETGDFNLEGLFVRLESAINCVGARRVVLDTIEVLFSSFESSRIIRSEICRLFDWLKDKGVTAIVTGERGENTLTRYGLEEYVSDCVIVLKHRGEERISTRQLRVVKYRGSSHGDNEYPFLIDRNGISAFPITSLGLDYPVSSERIGTGIEALDNMLGGEGFYRGMSILVSGTAGTGKSSLAATFADAACSRGERCLYISFEEGPAQIIRDMGSIGLNLNKWVDQGNLKFENERPYRRGLEQHLLRIQRMVQTFDPHVLIADPISNLKELGDRSKAKSMQTRLIDFLKRNQITVMLTDLTPGSGDTEESQTGVSSLMDSWILLRGVERDGERNNVMYILKSRGMGHSKQVREFLFTDDGIQLVDVSVGPEGVLTGTARYTQEIKEKKKREATEREIERRNAELERKRKALESRIDAMQAEFELEKTRIQKAIGEQKTKLELEEQAREARHQMRGGDENEHQ